MKQLGNRWAIFIIPLYLSCFILFISILASIQIPNISGDSSSNSLQTNFPQLGEQNKYALLDNQGRRINLSYHINLEPIPLHYIPIMLQQAFIIAEDQRFYDHYGVDWIAKFRAVIDWITLGGKMRGASTISEQVVRIINPRPRKLWSKILEATEAMILEYKYTKASILEFYLNNVPYASNHAGVQEAAQYYFSRDLRTLNPSEILTLAILVRSPSAYDLKSSRDKTKLVQGMRKLANKMVADFETVGGLESIMIPPIIRQSDNSKILGAGAFSRFVLQANGEKWQHTTIRTTLDGQVQNKVYGILKRQLQKMKTQRVNNAGVLVIEALSGNIIVWVSFGDEAKRGRIGVNDAGQDLRRNEAMGLNPRVYDGFIDTVTTPRQAGSTLKPFLYALALERGWTQVTLIDDRPIQEAVGHGVHKFHNYSRRFYQQVTLREALGNSLNIPAIHALEFIGNDNYEQRLSELGFTLNLSTDRLNIIDRGLGLKHDYGKGLAIGNIEVSLYQLVRAYTSFANGGHKVDLHAIDEVTRVEVQTVEGGDQKFNNAMELHRSYDYMRLGAAEIIRDILQDPKARMMEFGADSILNFARRVSVKTGTSNDYKDAWAVGFDKNYVVGIWFGNLNNEPTDGVTGANGPAIALRSIFGEIDRLHRLNKGNRDVHQEAVLDSRLHSGMAVTYGLPHDNHPSLLDVNYEHICDRSQTDGMIRWTKPIEERQAKQKSSIHISYPYEQMHFAVDPRISPHMQVLRLQGSIEYDPYQETDAWKCNGYGANKMGDAEESIVWYIDDMEIAKSTFSPSWVLSKGSHKAKVCLKNAGERVEGTSTEVYGACSSCDEVTFHVF